MYYKGEMLESIQQPKDSTTKGKSAPTYWNITIIFGIFSQLLVKEATPATKEALFKKYWGSTQIHRNKDDDHRQNPDGNNKTSESQNLQQASGQYSDPLLN